MTNSYKKGRMLMCPNGFFGIRFEVSAPYKFPAGHPCHGCPYTLLNSTVPSCMFPEGGCIRYQKDQRQPEPPKSNRQLAADKIQKCVETLKTVQKRKGYN
ncbi:MAG TPA: hypothetical protein DEP23_02265 [Ruminococcaceae bacterium]|nr:hypothetical protein [Oscillospiraceae bacterium]